MTFLVEPLAELRKHLDHLDGMRGRIHDSSALGRDPDLHSDLLFSPLTVLQLVIDTVSDLTPTLDFAHIAVTLVR